MVFSLNTYCYLCVCLKNKDYKCLVEKLTNLEGIYNSETEKLRSDLERLQLSEEEAKVATGRVLSLQEEIAKLRKDLEQTRSEKKCIEERADQYKQETEQVGIMSISLSTPYTKEICCHHDLVHVTHCWFY